MLARLLRLPGYVQIIGIIIVMVLVYLVARPVWSFLSCPFGLCTTKEELRAEILELRGRLEVVEAEGRIARAAIDAANRTDVIERVAIRERAIGRREIEAAAEARDFDALYAAYLSAYRRILPERADHPSGPPDSREGRPARTLPETPARYAI